MTDSTLIAAVERELAAAPHRRIHVLLHEGQRYVVKRLAERPRRWLQVFFMRWLVKKITGQPLPLRTLSLSDSANSMDYEARRLIAMAAAGVAVPRVLHHCNDYLLIDHCGDVVAELLEHWAPDEWRSALPHLATELGQFHAAGQWHGGAQIKNITLRDGRFTRIDFEENFGEFLPLPVTQATDLVLFLNSVSLAGPIDDAESHQLLPQLLAAYREGNPQHSEVDRVLQRTLPWVRRLIRIAQPFRKRSRKSVRRLEIMADVLDAYLSNT